LSSTGFFASDRATALDKLAATKNKKQSSRNALGLINLLVWFR